jgi:DNA processing protein
VNESGAPTRRPSDGSAVDRPAPSEAAHVAALLGLGGMGPNRLAALLEACGSARGAWELLRSGRMSALAGTIGLHADEARLIETWRREAMASDPAVIEARHQAAGIRMLAVGDPGFPRRLVDDPAPAALLFVAGSLAEIDRVAVVALVGTRRATAYGLRLARRWGQELAEAGVVVVSGLAAGIDAAAHAGVLAACEAGGAAGRPVAVVGTGLDVVYPQSSAGVWRGVATVGAVISEAPLGVRPDPWRFPARNRIIAGLADVVVVIESQRRGGSLLTAEEADLRGRTVLAVPGPVHAPTSAGTLHLIADGAGLATNVDDILLALGTRSPRPARSDGPPPTAEPPSGSSPLEPDERALLDAFGWQPALVDHLVDRTGWSLVRVCRVLEGLLRRRLVNQNGVWFTQAGD